MASNMASDIVAMVLTLKLAGITTILLLILCAPLAWWLAHTRAKWAYVVQAAVMLPLVLPPTVLGFYLLVAMAPNGFLGQMWDYLGLGRLSFSFTGLIIGSVIYSLPFAVQPMQRAFAMLGRAPVEEAAVLGAGPVDAFFTVVLPQARGGVMAAALLSFAHTVGEFGVVLMIGGNIEGQTRVVSVQIYDYVEAMEYGAAHFLALILVAFSFIVLLALHGLERQR